MTAGPLSGLTASTLSASLSAQTAENVWPGKPKDTAGKMDWKAQKKEQARIRKRQNDQKKAEEMIQQLEKRDGQIDTMLTLEEVYTDVGKLVELNQEKEEISKKLEVLYDLWAELAEEETTKT